MRLGISYSVFDGLELLEHSIKQIRQYVDFISIIWQEQDWYGKHDINYKGIDILHDLKKKKLIDDLTLYTPLTFAKTPIDAKYRETEKRNIGKYICEKNGCDFHMSIDVDEFYMPEQFQKAKQYLIDNNINYSFCNIQEYYKMPIYRKKEVSNSYVTFISKIDKELGANNLSLTIDGTRGIILDRPREIFHIFDKNELVMHHMSTVRKDLKSKYESSSMANIDRNNLNKIISNVYDINENNLKFEFLTKSETLTAELEVAPNIFNIPLNLF
ncbi:MAG: hypothetical protein ABSG25_10310 [Bryobacteraceae bacterium]